MGITMNEKKLKAFANELAKDIKTPEDLSVLTAHLTKITVEAALNAELDHHLGYTQYEHRVTIRRAIALKYILFIKAL